MSSSFIKIWYFLFLTALLPAATANAGTAAYRETPPEYLNPQLQHVSVEDSDPKEHLSICPSVCELADGSLLIAYHRTTGVDWMGGYSTWTRVSHDGGQTWSEAKLFANKLQSPGLLRLQSGDILLWGCAMLGDETKTYSEMEKRHETTMKLWRSKDSGKTWSEERAVWEKSNGIRLQGGAATMIQLKSGRILCPFCFGKGGNSDPGLSASCYFSDDDGKTWTQARGKVSLPKRGAMSPVIAEFQDGALLMVLRTQLGFLYFSRSTDHGETWSPAWSSRLESPENDAIMATFPGSDELLLVYTDAKFVPEHHHSGERTPLSAFVSNDQGKTWRKVGTIAGGPHEFGATGICFTSSGKVVIAYCWERIAWERTIKTGGAWLAIAERKWFREK